MGEYAVQDVHLDTDLLLHGGCSGNMLEVNLGYPCNLVRHCVPSVEGSQVCGCGCHLHSNIPLPLEGYPYRPPPSLMDRWGFLPG